MNHQPGWTQCQDGFSGTLFWPCLMAHLGAAACWPHITWRKLTYSVAGSLSWLMDRSSEFSIFTGLYWYLAIAGVVVVIVVAITVVHCVSKKRHWCSSTNFNHFWQRCCWESVLSNGDLLLFVFETQYCSSSGSSLWRRNFIFGVPIHLQNILLRFLYQGRQVKVKVTAAKCVCVSNRVFH